ncbi:response regulator transcription factor [Flavobacterium sp.]|uniref:response regulator transcription factor n=1 Tax=Flavobacterium sp. TaxID=239 RepID=UPI003D6B2B67
MRILIIEDEAGISNFLRQGLEEEGYETTVAVDGLQGILLAEKQKPDLILLDWMLPKLTGIDVCKAVREKDKTTPILFLTAKDTVQDTIEGLKSGANDYIKKPFNFEELLERIKIHFRNTGKNKILKLGGVEINVLKHTVLANDKEINFTQREFDLLKYLIENKRRVCTRNEIIENVWGIHFEYDTGVIDVFMNAIRKKLNFKKEEEFIKTIRGVGYIADDNN